MHHADLTFEIQIPTNYCIALGIMLPMSNYTGGETLLGSGERCCGLGITRLLSQHRNMRYFDQRKEISAVTNMELFNLMRNYRID